jgi:hypothetical protein
MAEFWRALRTLKALQAEQALGTDAALAGASDPARAAATARRSHAAERTRARRPGPTRIPPERAARVRRPARARRPLAAERTRDRPRLAPCSPEPAADLDGISARAQRATNVGSARFPPIMRRPWRCHRAGNRTRSGAGKPPCSAIRNCDACDAKAVIREQWLTPARARRSRYLQSR